ACLVLDDATGTVTGESVRHIQRLRTRNAGVVLTLRSVADVPEALHGPLYAAVGCRMAFSGVTTWDGSRFAQIWGTEWVETTTGAVAVRPGGRGRWSASELAHEVPPGHAVLSLTTVEGEHTPPLLVNLRD